MGLSGTVLLFSGLILASYSTNIPSLFVTFGIMGGAGANLSFSPGLMLIPITFKESKALATGMAVAGSGVGTLIVSQALNAAIEAAGWRVALRGLAIACLVGLTLASAHYVMPKQPTQVKEEAVGVGEESDKTFHGTTVSASEGSEKASKDATVEMGGG